ncbi:hypothetical protein [Gimesia maris]|uniref:hypothetical protein n=1 Tax=Gimesia maris TaxID=122 RepID=UPI0030DBA1C7|tara:strand:- start:46639 stop:48423 length:1785 start_codon:yes stop_codon:yes gene_type:complete
MKTLAEATFQWNRPGTFVLLFLLTVCLSGQNVSRAQEPASSKNATSPQTNKSNLSDRQEAISQQFKRFESTLHDLGEYMKKTDPARADLLFRAFGQSKQNQMTVEMQRVLQMLDKGQLGDAVERQENLLKNMQNLLALLQSEDRMSEVEKEKQRIQDLLKDVNRLIGQERDVRAATERGGKPADLTEKQQKAAENARKLVDKIEQQDAEKNDSQKSDQKSQSDMDPQSSEKKEEGQQKDQKSQEGKSDSKSDADSRKSSESESQGKPPENGKSDPDQKGSEEQKSDQQSGEQQQSQQQQQGQQGKPQEGENQQSQEQQQQKKTPGREQIEQARQEMEKAIEELEKKQKDAASRHQDDAIRKLAEAKEKLEEMLRQLREEERELMLAAMEARLQKILAQQKRVYAGTLSIGQVPEKERTSRHTARAVQLSREESQIGLEVEKAILLITDEGSSVAFSEALAEVREDVQNVSYRLNRVQVDELTQGIEKDIISSLEEMIEALQKEMDKSDEEKKKQQQQQQQQGSPEDQALIDMLAEIKMLRSLQLRVNNRTRRIEKLALEEGANQPDILEQLQKLANRQTRIQNATYILATGKNK